MDTNLKIFTIYANSVINEYILYRVLMRLFMFMQQRINHFQVMQWVLHATEVLHRFPTA